MKEKILKKNHEINIPELKSITSLNNLEGSFVNMECELPNGTIGKVLDDNKMYYGTQVEKQNSDRCYGIAADENQIAVFEYGTDGVDGELVAWVKI